MLWQDKSTRGCPQKFIRQREVKGMRELRRLTREFLQEEDAVGVVEIILILSLIHI